MKNLSSCIIKGVLALLCLHLSSAANIPLDNAPSNSLSNSLSPVGAERFFDLADWVQISQAPPRLVQRPRGAHLELECEAVGSPSPTIQWLRGDTAVTENESYESNLISETSSQGLSKIKARLVIPTVSAAHQGILTCAATSGAKTVLASTSLIVMAGSRNFSQFLAPLGPTRVRIVLFNTVVMEPMGADLIMPCKSIGSPKPDIFWIDSNEQLVTGQDPRVQVLPDGELRVRDLAWRDMGSYTCVARNAFSKDTITTFIYPLLNEH